MVRVACRRRGGTTNYTNLHESPGIPGPYKSGLDKRACGPLRASSQAATHAFVHPAAPGQAFLPLELLHDALLPWWDFGRGLNRTEVGMAEIIHKAVSTIIDEHRAQLINYLRGLRMRLGLLVNYGRCGGLQHERIVL